MDGWEGCRSRMPPRHPRPCASPAALRGLSRPGSAPGSRSPYFRRRPGGPAATDRAVAAAAALALFNASPHAGRREGEAAAAAPVLPPAARLPRGGQAGRARRGLRRDGGGGGASPRPPRTAPARPRAAPVCHRGGGARPAARGRCRAGAGRAPSGAGGGCAGSAAVAGEGTGGTRRVGQRHPRRERAAGPSGVHRRARSARRSLRDRRVPESGLGGKAQGSRPRGFTLTQGPRQRCPSGAVGKTAQFQVLNPNPAGRKWEHQGQRNLLGVPRDAQ